ncbi:MAG: hypothetical protein HDS77_06895 [Bacteroidales bacterium]|nr:hypothetical protein [Bacteroidales bacterium]
MGCYNGCNKRKGTQTGTRAVVLKFRRKNLDYSIENSAYIESHVMKDESECIKHMVSDICQSGNRDHVTRLLAVIHAGVIEKLYPFTKREVVEEVIDDNLWEPPEYVITIHVPVTFSQTSCHLLSRLIHEYMVYQVLYDWLKMTDREKTVDAQHWLEKAEAVAKKIDKVKNYRRGTLERPMHPF